MSTITGPSYLELVELAQLIDDAAEFGCESYMGCVIPATWSLVCRRCCHPIFLCTGHLRHEQHRIERAVRAYCGECGFRGPDLESVADIVPIVGGR